MARVCRFVVACGCASLIFLLSSPSVVRAQGGGGGGGGGGATPVIQSAEPNTTSGVLTITGTGFGTSAPTVTLGGFSLTPLSFNNTQIVASLPALLPKSYLLSVTKSGTTLNAKFEVTIEAGDVSGVSAGTGLNGGGLSGDLTLAVNTNVIQARVAGSCAAGEGRPIS